MKFIMLSIFFLITAIVTFIVYPDITIDDQRIRIDVYELEEMILSNEKILSFLIIDCKKVTNLKSTENLPQNSTENIDSSNIDKIAVKYLNIKKSDKPNCKEEIDSLKANNDFLKFVQANMSKAATPAVAYITFKKLNNLSPKKLKLLMKSNGASHSFLRKLPKKWTSKQIKYLKGSKSVLVGIMASSAVFSLMDDSKFPTEKKLLLGISVFFSVTFFWKYLQSKDIAS